MYVCCDNGREGKLQNELSFLFCCFLFFSLCVFLSLIFLLSPFCCTRAIERIFSSTEEKKEKEEENEISLSNKNTITTMLLLFTACQPTWPPFYHYWRTKIARKRKEIRACMCARARIHEWVVCTQARTKEKKCRGKKPMRRIGQHPK